MYSIFLPTFNQIWIFLQTLHTSKFSWHTFINVPSIKFHGNPSSGSEGDIYRWMDKHDDANMSFPMAMRMHITKDYNCSHSKDIHGWPRGSVWDTIQAVVYGQPHPMWLSSVTIKSDHLQIKHITHIIDEGKGKIWKQVIRYSKDQFKLLQKCQECMYKDKEHFWQLLYSQQVLQDLSFLRWCS